MDNLKRGSAILGIISGIFESIVAFIFYWVIYAILKVNDITNMSVPMVVLMCGLLGGILAIVISFFVRSTKVVGACILLASSLLMIFATIFLISQMSGLAANANDSVMIMLPFFIVPNALCLAGGVMGVIGGCIKAPAKEDK